MEQPKKKFNKDKLLYGIIFILSVYAIYASNIISVGVVDNSLIFTLNITPPNIQEQI